MTSHSWAVDIFIFVGFLLINIIVGFRYRGKSNSSLLLPLLRLLWLLGQEVIFYSTLWSERTLLDFII